MQTALNVLKSTPANTRSATHSRQPASPHDTYHILSHRFQDKVCFCEQKRSASRALIARLYPGFQAKQPMSRPINHGKHSHRKTTDLFQPCLLSMLFPKVHAHSGPHCAGGILPSLTVVKTKRRKEKSKHHLAQSFSAFQAKTNR